VPGINAGLVERAREARKFDRAKFVPFAIGAEQAGWIRRDAVASLRRWPDVFHIEAAGVRLEPERASALAEVTRALLADGAIGGWRDETCAVRIEPHGAPLFHIERAAMRFFGLRSAAAHLNGYVRDGDGLRVWIARRSKTKSIDPGMLDKLVGGAIASGQDAWQALLRECREEAGIERSLAQQARAVSILEVCHEVAEGLHREILYAHDLELPADFHPRNVDGEVGEFLRLRAAEVAERIANGEFSVEAGLLTLEWLLRRQAIECEDPLLAEAVEQCRLRP